MNGPRPAIPKPNGETVKKDCLRCDEQFDSVDPKLNRICPICSGSKRKSEDTYLTEEEKTRMDKACARLGIEDHSWVRSRRKRSA